MINENKLDLQQMQNYFEGQMGKIRTISDLQLSERDYKTLSVKLKSLSFFSGSENDMDNFMLSIVVYCVYSLIYNEGIDDFETMIWSVINHNQYIERLKLRTHLDTFEEYGINTFGISGTSYEARCKNLTAKHAGVPNCEKNAYYDLISCYLEYNDVERMSNEIFEQLPPKTIHIFEMMDDNVRNSIFLETRIIIQEVLCGKFTRKEIIERHEKVSLNLVDYCLFWNENNKLKRRYR